MGVLTLGQVADAYRFVVVDTSAFHPPSSFPQNIEEYNPRLRAFFESVKQRENIILIEPVFEELRNVTKNRKSVRRYFNRDFFTACGKRKDSEQAVKNVTKNLEAFNDVFCSLVKRLYSNRADIDSDLFDVLIQVVDVCAERVVQNGGVDVTKENSSVDQEVIASAYCLAFQNRTPIALVHRDRGIWQVNEQVRRVLSARNVCDAAWACNVPRILEGCGVYNVSRVDENGYGFVHNPLPAFDRRIVRFKEEDFRKITSLVSGLEDLIKQKGLNMPDIEGTYGEWNRAPTGCA